MRRRRRGSQGHWGVVAVDADPVGELALGFWAHTLPGPAITIDRSTVSVPSARAATPWPRPSRTPRRCRRARSAEDHVGEWWRRDDTDALHPGRPSGHHAHDDRRRVGGLAAGPHRSRRLRTGTSRRATVWPCGNSPACPRPTPASATIATFMIAVSRPARTSGSSRPGSRRSTGTRTAPTSLPPRSCLPTSSSSAHRRPLRPARSDRRRRSAPREACARRCAARERSQRGSSRGRTARTAARARPHAALPVSARRAPGDIVHHLRRERAGDRVGDQSGRRREDLLALDEPVGAKRRAVAVRSTIASTMPVRGASSTDPFTSTISACRPVA